MTLAVIKTGGKQYLVSPQMKIEIEKIKGKVGERVDFDEVLLYKENGKIEIGKPFLKNVKVIGEILKQGKKEKVIIFKFRPKKRYKKKKGHRQPFTEIKIVKIEKNLKFS